jgi:DNA-binding NarL/FixJ family response regulator
VAFRRYYRIEAAHGKAREAPAGPGHLLQWYEQGDDPVFTGRELDVALLLAEGLLQKEIAARLYVSLETVKSHSEMLRFRSGRRTAAGAVAFLFREGWIW